MNDTIAQLLIKLGVDASEAEKASKKLDDLGAAGAASAGQTKMGWKDVAGSLKEVAAAAVEAGKVLGSAAVAGTVALGTAVLKTGAEFEKFQKQLENLEGSKTLAEDSFERLQDFAKATPFALDQSIAAYVKLRNLGLDASDETLTAFGDFSSTMGKDMMQFVEAVADATTFEFERLKEFGVKAKQEGDKVFFTFRGQTTEVEKSAAAVSTYLKGLGQMEGIAGAMAGQASTLGGQMSALEDTAKNFLNTVAQSGPMEEFKGLIEDIGGLAGDEGGLAQILGDGLVAVIKELREWVQSLTAEDIEGWFRLAGNAMKDVASALGTVIDVFTWLVEKSGGIDRALRVIAAGLVAISTASMGPVGVVVAIGAVVHAADQVFGISDVFADMLADVTGLNDELDELGKRSPKRGAPELLGGGNVEKKDVVAFSKGGKEMYTERDTLIGIAGGEIKSDSLSQAEASRVLEQIYAEDLSDLSKKARANAAPLMGGGPAKKKGGKGKKKDTSEIELSDALLAIRTGQNDPKALALLAKQLSAKTPSTKDIKPTVAIDFYNLQITQTIKGSTDAKANQDGAIKAAEKYFKTAMAKTGQQLANNIVR